jgi:hypothetical protein
MRRPLILTLAFIGSMVLGVVLLFLITVAIGFVEIAIQHRSHSGIGAVAGGTSELSVLLTPFLFGVIGVLITLRQNRTQKIIKTRRSLPSTTAKMEY